MTSLVEQAQATPYDEELAKFLEQHSAQDYCPHLNCNCHTDTGYHLAVTDVLLYSPDEERVQNAIAFLSGGQA